MIFRDGGFQRVPRTLRSFLKIVPGFSDCVIGGADKKLYFLRAPKGA